MIKTQTPTVCSQRAGWDLCWRHIPGAVVSPILYLHSTRG